MEEWKRGGMWEERKEEKNNNKKSGRRNGKKEIKGYERTRRDKMKRRIEDK